MSKAKEILDGWSAYVEFTPMTTVEEKIAEDRAKICGSCPFAVEKGLLKITMPDEKFKEIQGYKCSKCGCPLSTKIRSITSQCPEKKWKE